MKRNLSPTDKGIRIGAALIIAALNTLGVIEGVVAAVFGVVAVVLVATSVVSFCPIYALLNVSTRDEGTEAN